MPAELRKIKAVVQMTIAGFRCKGKGIVVHLSDQVNIVIGALSASGKLCVLRRKNQYILAADPLDARAFPHPAESFITGNL